MSTYNTASVATRVARIVSGSCTPACDLVSLVREGALTDLEALRALRTHHPDINDLFLSAQDEIDYMRRNDI